MSRQILGALGAIALAMLVMPIARSQLTINVELDWMDPGSNGHAHRPEQIEIDAVVQMFACHGITLNVEFSNAVAHQDIINFDGGGANSFAEIRQRNQNNPGWHYCLFAHRYSEVPTSSGRSNGHDAFVVTMGAFHNQSGTDWDRAATFAHELGHDLGLSHDGGTGGGDYKPNFPSIMSYFYQLTGVRTNLESRGLVTPGLTLFKNLDYSNGISCTLNEAALDEHFGSGFKSVDWNCNGDRSEIVAHDISNNSASDGWCEADGSLSTLTDTDEWGSIVRILQGSSKPIRIPPPISCVTYDEHRSFAKSLNLSVQPRAIPERCTQNKMIFVRRSSLPANGSCGLPYTDLFLANESATDGDIIYFWPGSHPVPTDGIFLTKRLILAGPGGITIGTP